MGPGRDGKEPAWANTIDNSSAIRECNRNELSLEQYFATAASDKWL